MERVSVAVDLPNELTIAKLEGLVSPTEIIAAKSLDGFGSTRKLLWDLCDADLSGLNIDGFMKIAKAYKEFDAKDKAVAVALLVSEAHEIKLMKLYREISIRMLGRPERPFLVTTSRQEALAWLASHIHTPSETKHEP